MTQLTLRGFDTQLEQYLRQLAHRRGLSLNKAALFLMRKGAGLDTPAGQADVVGSSLDDFIGVWSKEEAQDFSHSLESFEKIDQDFWQ